jgi:hypothetical protein
MSVRKDPRSPYWHYNFQIGGRRYCGSTKARTERDAEAIERAMRERAMRGYIQPRKRKPKPNLYLIRANSGTRFKIGIAADPKSRLSGLRVARHCHWS